MRDIRVGRWTWAIALVVGFASVGCVSSVTLPGEVDARLDGGPDVGCNSVPSEDVLALDFGPTPAQPATTEPVPLSGGTVAVSADQQTAIASDPDHDVVWLVNVGSPSVRQPVRLQAGDEPGRIVEDSAHVIHVVLRRAGAIADISLSTGTLVSRRAVCAAPRGIDFDPHSGNLYVACVDGTFVSLPASGTTTPTAIPLLDPTSGAPFDDLRDVAFDSVSGHIYVSRFRAASIIDYDPTAAHTALITLPATTLTLATASFTAPSPQAASPEVAWRMIRSSTAGLLVVYQYALEASVCPSPGGYGESVPPVPIVQPAIASSVAWPWIGGGSSGPTTPAFGGSLTAQTFDLRLMMNLVVDVATAPSGESAFAVAGAGAGNGEAGVRRFDVSGNPLSLTVPTTDRITAVAYTNTGSLVLQTRSQLWIESVPRSGNFTPVLLQTALADPGYEVFHSATGGGLTCAGCHPEGGDDGHVWNFTGLGPRRTQNLRGGTSDLAPFHWDGRFPTMDLLLTDVYHGRMTGPLLTSDQVTALTHWLDAVPNIPHAAPVDAAAVARGATLFNDATVACSTCHSGGRFTNNSLQNVGTGATVKVPALTGVAFRAPYLHDGSAASLSARFMTTGSGMHGNTSGLSSSQISDLVAYLRTL